MFAATRLSSAILATLTVVVTSQSIATANAASPTLEKIRSSGKLTFGYREASIPFAYLGADQKPVGLSLDLCSAVADKVKAELKTDKLEIAYVAVNASNRIPLLQNGTVDVECGSTSNTAERQKQVSFSSSPLAAPKDLQGKTLIVTQGSLNLGVAEKVIGEDKLGATIVQTKDHGESILMLRTGRAAAWF